LGNLKTADPIINYEIAKLENYQIAEAAVTFDLSTLA
jgi:hypothetical protein